MPVKRNDILKAPDGSLYQVFSSVASSDYHSIKPVGIVDEPERTDPRDVAIDTLKELSDNRLRAAEKLLDTTKSAVPKRIGINNYAKAGR
jgi:hypothetical protein